VPASLLAWLPHLWRTVLFPGSPLADGRVRPLSLLVVLLLPAALLYPSRGFHLLEPDEGRYAQIPKEMLLGGEWVVPTLQGEPYLDKPPLMYWLVAGSYSLFGVSEASARLVPAVCVHLTILLVYLVGRRSLGERPAFWAAVLLTVAPGYVGVARLLLLDGLLTLCVSASVLCGFEAVRTGTLRRGWWLGSAVASGLGFLTKGPISEILLLPPLFVFGWLSGRTARVRGRDLAVFAGVVLLVNLPWYVGILLREPAFLGHFFWEHNVLRFLQPFDHLQPVWYYAPILVGGLLPGTVLLVPYVRDLLLGGDSERRSPAGGFWLLAGGWCVLFFSVSGSKLPTYILPAFPFLCLALGEYVARSRWNDRLLTKGLVTVSAGLLLALHTVGVPWYARERSPFGRPDVVARYVSDPAVPVATYPRNCDSVAFYSGRADFEQVRSKEINQLMVDIHHRPATVVLFTHRHSFEAFRQALPESLEVAESVSLKRDSKGLLARLVGDSPWGLADVAVVRPAGVARGQKP
jgi:4-amino-4-deoxy-L-arabinose transferase-like glycosyltransferase